MNINTRMDLQLLLPEKAWVAEIGVAEGHFSEEFLKWGVDRIYMVDIWSTYGSRGDNASDQSWHNKNYEGAKNKVERFGRKAIILKGFSGEMADYVPDHSLDMVYLDGGHDYLTVFGDLITWSEKLKIGGIMAGHDYLSPEYGVFDAVRDFHNLRRFNEPVNTIPDIDQSHAGFWFVNEYRMEDTEIDDKEETKQKTI